MNPSITAIEPGRRRGRFNIYVEGAFAAAAGEKVIADLGLRVGQLITAERLRAIADAEEARRALESALRLLEIRARATKEIEQRLRQKGYEDDTVTGVIAALRRMELIDDAEFARQWVASRSRSRPKGARMLRSELAQKGIVREEIDIAVSDITPDDELELARKALAPKIGRKALPVERMARHAEYQRLAGFLQRRGFGWETVKTALKDVFGRNDDDQADESKPSE